MEKLNNPEIRFKEYLHSWYTVRLGDITDCYSGGTPTVGVKHFYGGNIPFIRSGEISDSKTELFLTNEGVENSSAKLVKKNDVLYALYGATSGEVSLSKINGAINQAILAIIPSHSIKPEFIVYWLRKAKSKIISNYLQGGQGNLSAEIVKDLLVSLPNSDDTNEQTQIGQFFQNLDQSIAMQEQKLAQTQNLKQAMLEKMFPKAGSKQPEIRLKGFSGEWEIEFIGNVLQEVLRPVNLENETKYRLITVKRRNGGISERDVLKGKEILVNSQFEVKAGDFIISKRQVVHGATGLVPQKLDGSIVSNEYFVSRGTVRLNIEFFALLSTLPMMYKKFFLSSYGVDIEKLFFDVDDWKKREVLLPSLAEQTQMSEFFKRIDETIILQQQQLQTLKNLKQAFLAKMFV